MGEQSASTCTYLYTLKLLYTAAHHSLSVVNYLFRGNANIQVSFFQLWTNPGYFNTEKIIQKNENGFRGNQQVLGNIYILGATYTSLDATYLYTKFSYFNPIQFQSWQKIVL